MASYNYKNQKPKLQCPQCKRWFTPQGLNGHLRFAHDARLPTKRTDPATGQPLLSKPRPTLLYFNAEQYEPAPPVIDSKSGLEWCDWSSFHSHNQGDYGMRRADFLRLREEGAIEGNEKDFHINPSILGTLIRKGIIKKQDSK